MISIKLLTHPPLLYSRSAVLSKPSPVPQEPGIYAWFFKDIPVIIPTDGCITKDNLTLLYVGISPDKVGNPNSKQNLRKRITNHYRGNAEGSTLRRSLGVLLTEQSDFPLRRVGSGNRMTFTHLGEQRLDDWMEDNAFVCWLSHPEPWVIEDELIETLSLPLNIKGNKGHSFADILSQLRKDAIRQANEIPIANEDNQQRRMKVHGPIAVSDESDEEIRQKVYKRFQNIFDSSLLVVSIPVTRMGTPPREWIPAAVAQIEELIDTGVTINESCWRVAKEIAAANNIKPETVEMTYRRHQREHWHEEFCRCIITKDIESAVTAYKRLTENSKQKLKLS